MQDRISILLIEDDPDHQERIVGYLDMVKLLEVDYAVSGSVKEAQDLLEKNDYDIIVSDLSLPDSGIDETLPKLIELNLDIPIIVMTSLDDVDTIMSMIQAGAADCIPKIQLSSSVLERTLQYTIDRFKDRKMLVALKEEAEQANRMKTEFLQTMSHELKTPLNAIVGFSDFLISCDIDPEYSEMVTAIYNSGKQLTDLVTDILEYSKMDAAASYLIKPEMIDLEDVIKEVVSIHQIDAEKKEVSVDYKIEDVEKNVLLDPLRIRNVLNHLVSNAVKFTDSGSVHIQASMKVSGVLEFMVQDTGVGISADHFDEIFKPFQQLDSKIDRKFGGTGLGLAICKKLVNLMGGEIFVQSDIGVGSRFIFNLPTSTPEIENNKMHVDLADISTEVISDLGLKVLVIDDFDINHMIYSKYLQKFECHTTMTESVESAIAILKKEQFDVIFMDILMPGLSGLELTKMSRQGVLGEALKSCYIIGQTTRYSDEDLENCLNAGMNDCLPKPVSLEHMHAALLKYKNSV